MIALRPPSPPDTAVENDPADSSTSLSSRVYYVAMAVVLVPFVVSIVAVLVDGGDSFHSDRALMELAVRNVGRHPVLIGLYSRAEWNHPGPFLYYLLAIPYRLTGGNPAGLLVGALVINAGAVVGMGAVAKRLGGTTAAVITLLGAGVVVRALGANVIRDPWVCFVTVLPFGLFCVLVWAMTQRRPWALPASVATASWLVQTHIGFAPLTAPALIVGAAWLWVAAWRSDELRARHRILTATLIALGVLVVTWMPPIWDQLYGSHNLERAIGWFGNDSGVHTLPEGARVVFGQLAAVPDWVTGTRRFDAYNGETLLRTTALLPVLLVPFVAAVWFAVRRRSWTIVRLAGVVTFMALVSVIAVARTTGIMFEYRLLWTWLLGMLAGVVIVWTVWNEVARRWPHAPTKVMMPIAMVLLVGVSAAQVVDVVQAGSFDQYSPVTGRVTRQLAANLDPDGGQIVLRSVTTSGEFQRQGILLGLEKDGFDARSTPESEAFFGPDRLVDGKPVQVRLVVLTDGDFISYVPPPGAELIAYSGPEPLQERTALVRASIAEQERLFREQGSGTLSGAAFDRAFKASKLKGQAVAVYREP